MTVTSHTTRAARRGGPGGWRGPTTAANHAGLASLGLEPLVEEVYRKLLSRPSWPAERLAERLGFPEAEFADVLDSLAGLRLVQPGANGELRPVSPRIGLSALVSSREAELADRRWELEQSRLAAAAIVVEHDDNQRQVRRGTGSPDVVYGEAAVRRLVTAVLGEARHEVIAMSLSSGGYLDPVALPSQPCLAAVRRGVTVRAVYFDRVRSDPRLTGYLHELAGGGAFVRTAHGLPTSALAVDGWIVLLPVALSTTGRRPGVVLLRLPSVVTAAAELFERVWAGAAPVERELSDSAPNGLDAREHELLGMLLAGGTDEAAAARLGISVRTVRRMVAHLLELLGARCRFEAGARAMLHGWPIPATAAGSQTALNGRASKPLS